MGGFIKKAFSSTFGQIFFGLIGIIGGAITGGLGWALLGIGIAGSLAGGYFRAQQAKKAAQKLKNSNIGHLLNTRSSGETLSLVYGTCRVGGNIIFIHTDGKNNKNLYQVISMSEANINDVTAIFVNEDLATVGEPNSVLQKTSAIIRILISDEDVTHVKCKVSYFMQLASNIKITITSDELTIERGTSVDTSDGKARVEFKANGEVEATRLFAENSLSSLVITGISTNDGATYLTIANKLGGNFKWCANLGSNNIIGDTVIHQELLDRGFIIPENVAYIGVKLIFDIELFQNVPNLTMLTEGIKCYNPATMLTAFTDNPAVILYDYCTSTRYGLSIASSRIDTPSWIEVINYCDTQGFRFNGIITDGRALDVVQQILDHFRGALIYRMGKFELKFKDMNQETPVASITEADMVEDSFSIELPSRTEIPNRCKVNFINPETNYKVDSVEILAPDAPVGEEPRVLEIELYGCDRGQALSLGQYYLERARLNTVCSFALTHKYITFENADLIYLSYEPYGIENQIFRITNLEPIAEGVIRVGAVIENLALYDDEIQLDDVTFDLTTLPAPNALPDAVMPMLTEVLETAPDGIVRSSVRVSWEERQGLILQYHVWMKDSETNTYELIRTVTDSPVTFQASDKPMTYTVKVIAVSTFGKPGSFDLAPEATITTQGRTFEPGSVQAPQIVTNLSAEVIDNNVLLRWIGNPGVLPIKTYEIRKGEDYDAAEILGFVDVSFDVIFEVVGGSFRYWVTPFDTADNRGPEESITVDVNEPPDFVAFENVESTWSGTKVNFLVLPDGTAICPAKPAETFEQHFTTNSFDQIEDFIAPHKYWLKPVPNTGSYEEIFDFGQGEGMSFGDEFGGEFGGGAMIEITSISVELDKDFYDDPVDITPTISVSTDLETWTDFTGQFAIRATDVLFVKVHLDFDNNANGSFVWLNRMRVRLSVKLRDDGGTATITDANAGVFVPFNKDYFDVVSITMTAQGDGSQAITPICDFEDVPNPIGFTGFLLNNTNTKITGTFGWRSKGV